MTYLHALFKNDPLIFVEHNCLLTVSMMVYLTYLLCMQLRKYLNVIWHLFPELHTQQLG